LYYRFNIAKLRWPETAASSMTFSSFCASRVFGVVKVVPVEVGDPPAFARSPECRVQRYALTGDDTAINRSWKRTQDADSFRGQPNCPRHPVLGHG
jgi:hypothetical protein